MTANYHTHTVRCMHATGTEQEYIEQAIARGLQVLGFSDHSPQVFDGGYVSSFRMLPEELENYVSTLDALREKFKDRITIHIGLEAEYYPKLFIRLMDLIRPYHLEYLILGQHMTNNETDGQPSIRPTDDEKVLERYVLQTIEGMETGVFSCLAHPDLLYYTGDRKIYLKWYEKLCLRAKELGIPLEMNMLGYAEKRNYPKADFFRIVQEVGNEVILGCDAHNPERVADPAEVKASEAFLRDCGIYHTLDHLRLISPNGLHVS